MSDTIHANIIPAGSIGAKVKEILRGLPGEDGVSPTVSIEDIENGHRIIITDAEGEHSIDVMDGDAWTPTEENIQAIADRVKVPIKSIEVAGSTITPNNSVVSIPKGGYNIFGVAKYASAMGVYINNDGIVYVAPAMESDIDAKTHERMPIVPKRLDYAVKSGLADSKIEWTADEKKAAAQRIGAVSSDYTLIKDETLTTDTSWYSILAKGYSEITYLIKFSKSRTDGANFQIMCSDYSSETNKQIANLWMNKDSLYVQINIRAMGEAVVLDASAGTANTNQSTRYAGFALLDDALKNIYFSYSANIPAGSRIIVYGR